MTNTRGPRIGMIMDGNRRWAKERGLPSLEGHRQGYEKLKDVLDWCKEFDVPEFTIFAFSTENWNRDPKEVDYLMDILEKGITELSEKAHKEGIRLFFPGEQFRFSSGIQEKMKQGEEETKNYTERTFALALSYGGRREIVDAINHLPKEKIGGLTEEEFQQHLWTKDFRDPDMIIRTGGEKRLSGFLTWRSTYSELFFTDTHWPAFTKEEFARMLEEYDERERRFGK